MGLVGTVGACNLATNVSIFSQKPKKYSYE